MTTTTKLVQATELKIETQLHNNSQHSILIQLEFVHYNEGLTHTQTN